MSNHAFSYRELPLTTKRVKRIVAGAHINDLADKSAASIAKVELRRDKCHRRIARAADMLIKQERGHMRYGGQYQDGTTLWLDAAGNGEVIDALEAIFSEQCS